MSSTNDTMNFGVDLLPITNEEYNIGSSTKKWNIYGSLTGNASTATTLATGRTLQVSLGSTSASTAFDGSANISDIGVNGTLAATNGGTGQSTYTIGDILYSGSANALSKLSGNSTTTRKFLRSVATTAGTAVAPAWDTIQSGDLPLALYNAKGAIKPAYTTTGTASLGTTSQAYSNSPTISSRTTTSSRFYALEADKNGVGYTNVPWTDKNLLQEYKAASGYTYWRPLLIGYSSGSTSSFTPSTATNQSYTFSTLLVQPSTGTIKASIFDGNATTATKWASAQTAYVNLDNASTTTSIQGGSSNAAILGVNGVLGTANGGTGFSSTVYVNSVVIGNSTTDTGALQTIRTGNGAFYATEEDGVPDFGTLPVAQGGTGLTSFTANEVVMSGSTITSALTTRSITNNTSATAVTASTNIITANTLYYHTGNSNLTTVGTVTTGTWNATTIGAGYGGTGQSTYTVGDILYCGTANTLSKLGGNTTTTRKFLRSVATTSGTAVAPTWSEVTKTDVGLSNVTNDAQVKASLGTAKGDMLYWSASATPARLAIGTAGYFLKATADGPAWANTTDITALGTITTGTWQGTTVGTGYGGTGVASHTANRLVYSTSATTIQATNNHYVSATQMSINFTSAPHSGYTLLVGGHSEINGALSLQQPNASTQSLYFKNHTSTVLGVGARIYYWNGSASGITHSQLNFQEYSYNTTASATPLSFYEQYSLPDCNAGLGANATYDILTNKNVYPFPMCARQVSSSMTFDDMNAPGVYAVANNIKSTNTYPTSQTNAKYGILVVFGGTNSNNTAGNAMQLWFSGITNAGYYKLAIRAKYNGTWGAWSVIH